MHLRPQKSSKKAVLAPILLGIGLLSVTPRAHAVAPLENDSELFVTGVATVARNDNLFLSHAHATSATVYDLVPGLSYEFGKTNSATTGQLAFYEDFQVFQKSGNHLSEQLANAIFWTKYDDGKSKLNLDASFHQADQAQVGIQNLAFLVDRNLFHADALGEISATEKTSFGAGVAYDDTEYRTAGYTNYHYVEVPVNYYFEVEPKLDLSAGFRFRDNTLGTGGINGQDYFYNVGARGEFTPLLTGQFNVGYQEEKPATGPKQNALGLNSNFILAVDPKFSLTLGANEDYTYSPLGKPFRSMGVTGGFIANLTDQWSLNGQTGYSRYTYLTTPQKDDFYSGQLGLSYAINAHLKVTGSYTYAEDHSNIMLDSFTNNVFSASASLRF